MRLRMPLVIALLGLLLVAGSASAAEGSSPTHRIALGIANPDGNRTIEAFDRFSSSIGRRPAIWTIWSQWGLPGTRQFPTQTANQLAARGVTPMIWWEPVDPRNLGSPKFSRHRNITRGDHDEYIRSFARDAKRFGRTVILRFAHEPNGRYFPWSIYRFDNSKRTFIAAWRHVHRIFQRVGAKNVRFVWSVNKKRCPGGCNPYRSVFPGDRYVDIIGFSGHNWGASKGRWVPMYKGIRRVARQLRTISRKPMMIAELGTASEGGNKAAWIRRGYRMTYLRLPYIKSIIYLDADLRSIGHPDWSISSHRNVQAVFSDMASMPRFRVKDPFGNWRGR